MTLEPHDLLLNKYRIERLLGEGTFAQVYLATHVQLNAPRAIKVLRRDAPGIGSTEYDDCRRRFRLEAQLAAQITIWPTIGNLPGRRCYKATVTPRGIYSVDWNGENDERER